MVAALRGEGAGPREGGARHTREEDSEEEEEEEAQAPKRTRDPAAPSAQERRDHQVAHLPFRNWRKECMRGRGRSAPHVSSGETEVTVPMVTLDFFFLGEPGVEGTSPVSAMRDREMQGAVRARGAGQRGEHRVGG